MAPTTSEATNSPARAAIARYRRFDRCEACQGSRLNADALSVRVAGRTIAAVSGDTVEELRDWLRALDLGAAAEARTNRLIETLLARVDTVCGVGLGYVGLDRQTRTLSGGEAQRIKLSRELSKRSTGRTLYILDEPTTGLHFADVQKLLDVLTRLVNNGNTIVVIEHQLDVIKYADYCIDLGPEGGEDGGYVVATGTPEEVAKNPKSFTGHYLNNVL